jgi:putative membrane protein
MKKYAWATLLFAFAFCSCDKNDDNNNNGNNINSTDRDFVLNASMANTAEINAGQLASTKANDEGIKDFGQFMVTEHGTSKTQLKNLADSLQLQAPDSLDAEHVALGAQLLTLDGRSFDSVYIHSQVTDHQKTINLFQNEINNGNNSRLKDFANSQMPHLQEHLNMADSLAANF